MLFGQKNIARYISAQQQNYILRNDANMYIRLIRNEAKGNAISGRLVIDGRWFCYTLERKGVEIPALCYHVAVTMSPKFKRLLPLVTGVPRTGDKATGDKAMRQGIRFHRGSKPEHSTGCILVVADNINDNTDNLRGSSINDNIDNLRGNQKHPKKLSFFGDPALPAALKENNPCRSRDIDSSGTLSKLSSNKNSICGRTAADVENELTQLLLKAQNEHEEIILEVSDFRAGTEYGYNTPCERELQQYEIDARRAEQRYYKLHPEECKG